MSHPSYVVEGRAHVLARFKLIFDLLLAAGLYLSGAPLSYLIAPAADALLLLPYLRYVKRAPAILTMGTLALSAVLLALAPMGLGAAGVALWVLYPVLPMGAGFVLGRRQLLWQMAAITMAIAAAGGYLALMAGEGVILDRIASLVLLGALAACIWMTSWFAARALRSDSDRRDILGESLAVVKGVLVVPFNWVVGGVQSEALRLELHELKRRHNPRWIVLDLAPAGELGRRDLSAIERAAEAVSTGHCTIVLTRPPVDALGHLDFAQPAVGRIERYATVPQAVEAGLRRLGWSQGTDQPQRVVTTL